MTPKRGGRWRDHRQVLNGIVFRTRSGIPWRDLPERSGPWQTVSKRFARWERDGTWARIEASLRTQADGAGQLDWAAQIDSTVVRAHQHAAGARKGGSGPARSAAASARSARAVTGRADHQDPHDRRWARPGPGDPAHAGAGLGHQPTGRPGPPSPGCPAGWAWSAPYQGQPSDRGQGLLQPGQPGRAARAP